MPLLHLTKLNNHERMMSFNRQPARRQASSARRKSNTRARRGRDRRVGARGVRRRRAGRGRGRRAGRRAACVALARIGLALASPASSSSPKKRLSPLVNASSRGLAARSRGKPAGGGGRERSRRRRDGWRRRAGRRARAQPPAAGQERAHDWIGTKGRKKMGPTVGRTNRGPPNWGWGEKFGRPTKT